MKRILFLLFSFFFNQEGFINPGIFCMAPEGEGGGSGGASDGGEGEGNNNSDGNPGDGSQGTNTGDGSGNQVPDGQGSGNTDGNGDANDGNSGNSVDELPEWAQKEIKKLRGENAKHRTNFNNLNDRFTKLETGMKSALGLGDDDKLTPEQQVEALQASNQESQFENAILHLALENGISGEEEIDYFGFLIGKAAENLEEGQELSEDNLKAIIQKAKGRTQGSANSSVDGDGKGGNTPPPGGKDEVTLEQFCKMNILEKSKLYNEKREVYDRLHSQAKAKGML